MGAAGTRNRSRIAERYRDEELLELPRMLETSEVARILGMAPQTVRCLAQSGDVPAVRVGATWRYDRERIYEMIGLTYDDIYKSTLARNLAREAAADAWDAARGVAG